MTDKHTMEEKIQRLQELVPSVGASAISWLHAVGDDDREQFLRWVRALGNDEGIGEAVWDVHSGAAFTPLYRLL